MNSEITQAVNQQAHYLTTQSFAVIRLKLRKQAEAMLKERKPVDEVISAIQATVLPAEGSKP
ncbi:MAG: hypothetical protein D4R79_13350 [Comamonadaceae bacterium]|nr:MAG: hypothetical protein D4R79_13350 [Comamonadaceae bacterium]